MIDPFEIEFHDSHILDVDLDRCFQTMRVVVHAPLNTSETFIELTFDAILRMEFETLIPVTGDREHPLMISGLTRHDDDTQQRFLDRIRELEKSCLRTNEESKSHGFVDVFHVSIGAEMTHRGFGNRTGLNGIHLVCRRVLARPADKKWYKSAVPPSMIPGDPLDDISRN